MDHIELEEYKEHRIQANRVPEAQFEFGSGFGWALRVSDKQTDKPLFIAVVKSYFGERSQDNIDRALEDLTNAVHAIIDKDAPEKEYYCYRWEPDSPEKIPFSEADCDLISPRSVRSPLI